MKYTLLTTDGSVLQFYVLECAYVYQRIHGGVVLDEAILVSEALDKSTVLV